MKRVIIRILGLGIERGIYLQRYANIGADTCTKYMILCEKITMHFSFNFVTNTFIVIETWECSSGILNLIPWFVTNLLFVVLIIVFDSPVLNLIVML